MESPKIAINILLLAQHKNKLKMLLVNDGTSYSLPGDFSQAFLTFNENADKIVLEKANLDIKNDIKKQVKIYEDLNKDVHHHVITMLFTVFTDFNLNANGEWFDVNFQSDLISLKGPVDILIDSNHDVVGNLKYKNGHGQMIFDAISDLIERLFLKGELLQVYKRGFTLTEAWQLYQNVTEDTSSKSNIRRKILNVSERAPGIRKLIGRSYADIYEIKRSLT